MSGGTAVKTADSGGGSPVLHKRSAEGRGNRWLCQRLGLDGGRGHEAPKKEGFSLLAVNSLCARDGCRMAETMRLGSQQPGLQVRLIPERLLFMIIL